MAETKRKSTALKNAEKKIDELEKALKEEKSRSDSWYKSMNDKNRELEEVHAVLDVFPNPPARSFTPQGGYEKTMTLSNRLVAYIASEKK